MNEIEHNDGIVLQRFKRSMIKPGSVVLVLGKKNTGKTTVLSDLCHQFRGSPEVTYFSKTSRTNPAFRDIIPPLFCHDSWDRTQVSKLIDRQVERNERRAKQGRSPVNHVVIIDDFACDPECMKDPNLEQMIMNGRHLGFTIFIALQDALKVSPAIRNNSDWIFTLKESNPNARKRLRDHFFSFESRKEFDMIFDQVTDERGCLVFNQTSTSTKRQNQYFWWKATPRLFHENPALKRWKMGSKKWWRFNQRYYNPQWNARKHNNDEEIDNDDAMIILCK